METVQQNGRFTLFSSKFPSNIYSILYGNTLDKGLKGTVLNRGLEVVNGGSFKITLTDTVP